MFLFQYLIVNGTATTNTLVSYKRNRKAKVSPRSSSFLEESLLVRFEVKHTLDSNESANERGGAIVSIVIRLLLDGSVVVCLAKGASVRGVVLT